MEQLKRSINGEILDLKMFELICKLSLYVDDLTDEERCKAQSAYKQYIVILPSKNGGYYLYMKTIGYEGYENKQDQEKGFWNIVLEENNYRKKHNQDLIKYNIDKIWFFLQKD